MKKLVLTVVASLACVAAFAQGRITFGNDSLHLVYFTTDSSGLLAADAALAGTGPTSAGTTSGKTLVADLFAGTSSTALSLVQSTSFQATPGRWVNANTILPAPIVGGVPQFFQVQVRDSAAASATVAQQGQGLYYGFSIIFTAVPNSGAISYNSMTAHSAPSSSTWTDGSFALDVYGAGAKGAIVLQANPVPEPASFALAGLGIAALAILRRRK